MVSVADLLPATHAHTLVDDERVWAVEIDPRDSTKTLKVARSLFDLELPQAFGNGPTAVMRLARCVRSDILLDVVGAFAGADRRDRALVMLKISAFAATLALDVSSPGDAYDWLVYGLCESWRVEDEIEIFMDRPAVALASPTFAEEAPDVVDVWLTALFTYDAAVAGMRPTAIHQVPVAMLLLRRRGVSEHLPLVGAFLGWASRLSPETRAEVAGLSTFCRTVGVALERLVASAGTLEEVDPVAVSILALTPGEVTGQNQALHRETLLSLPVSRVRLVDRLDSLVASYSGSAEAIADDVDRLLEVVAEYSSAIAVSADVVTTRQRRTTQLAHVAPAAQLLMGAGKVTEAVRILAAWLRPGEDKAALQGHSVLACFRHGTGTTWAVDGAAVTAPEPGPDAAKQARGNQARFVDAANAFLGTTLVAPDNPVAPKLPAGVRGVPDPEAGAEFATAATDYAALHVAPPAKHPTARDRVGPDLQAMLVLPSLPAPIQALMVRQRGWTLPLSMSLRAPRPDRQIRRALVWLQGSMFNQREMDELVPRLEAAGVSVDVRSQADMTRERFLHDYCSTEFDLVWVGCHGEVNQLAPTEACLSVAPDGGIGLADLAPPDCSDEHGRRLLVLNACDSAAAFHYGGIGDLSLAGAAAGPTQAVVAHLWPIGSSVVAPVFAAALADGLADGQSFFDTYVSTVRTLARGAKVVGTTLSLAPAVAQATMDHPEEIDNLTGWASAAFIS
jgi:hypothetical protein